MDIAEDTSGLFCDKWLEGEKCSGKQGWGK